MFCTYIQLLSINSSVRESLMWDLLKERSRDAPSSFTRHVVKHAVVCQTMMPADEVVCVSSVYLD